MLCKMTRISMPTLYRIPIISSHWVGVIRRRNFLSMGGHCSTRG